MRIFLYSLAALVTLAGPSVVFAQAPTDTPQKASETPLPPVMEKKTEAPVSTPAPKAKEAPMPPEQSQGNGDSFQQPPLSKQEINQFVNEMKNVLQEAKRLLKDLTGVSGADEWKKTINDTVKEVNGCISKVSSGHSDDRRDAMNDCRSQNFFQDLQEIREQFVPPQELKNELKQMKDMEKQLSQFKRQLKSTPSAGISQAIDEMLKKIATNRTSISTPGPTQREALQEWRDLRLWDDMNGIRAQVEVPKQLRDIKRDLGGVEKMMKQSSLTKALAFFGFDRGKLQTSIDEKKQTIVSIEEAIAKGDFEEVNSLMQESIYNAWHPGDLRHLLDMTRQSYEGLRRVKDQEIKDQILGIIEPIKDSFNGGDYREARDAMVPFAQDMQRYQQSFMAQPGSGLNEKTSKALEKLDSLIRKKLIKEEPQQAE